MPTPARTVLAVSFAATLLAAPSAAQSPADGLTEHPLGIAAVEFLDLAFNEARIQEAFDTFVGEVYIQHNPQVPDGADEAVTAIMELLNQLPEWRYDFKRVLVDGDLVAVHSHVTSGAEDRGWAVVDIFRAEDGLFVEHWDVVQPVPESTANDNTMF